MWVGRQVEFGPDEIPLLSSIADIVANAVNRETMHEQTVGRVLRLAALRAIDEAIAVSVDLRVTLDVILQQAAGLLEADAMSILLLNRDSMELEYTAGVGFRTREFEAARVRLGEGEAGRAALDRRTVSMPDVQIDPARSRSAGIRREEFVSHEVAPLLAKGQVKGVFEAFHRSRFNPDADWVSFFETLASQVAISVDNIQMYERLEQSNLELSMAYDATIEGWSRALDMRDRETEGHTLRVTELMVRLSRAAGLGEEEIIHVRRGSLLHDIGKMGVPDSILFKPGALTEEEWALMHRHPRFAYDMLSPIPYLRRALDIPYCHHEKWDGSGYPRQLKGEGIPISARLFAIVDVWDALGSDRPYRSAWSKKDVLEHLRSRAGSHFDPTGVDVFLEVQRDLTAEQERATTDS
jgi:HD-GYP domain-containing protein (c-di-GMP phosphodiesterase class II)